MTSTSFALCTWGDRAYEPPKLSSNGRLSTERVETVSGKSVKNITKVPVRAAGTRFGQVATRLWTGDYGLLGEIDEAAPHRTERGEINDPYWSPCDYSSDWAL